MTDDDLAAIEAYCEASTPGPWHVRQIDDSSWTSLVAVSTKPEDYLPGCFGSPGWEGFERTVVAATLIQNPRYVDIEDQLWDENANFIARARTDLPRLVAEVRRLRAELKSGG